MSELQHVGVLGMHWGIRRRGPAHSDSTTAHTLKRKHVSELSNDELKKVINRMQLEKQFKDLSSAQIGRGRGILTKMLVGLGTQAVNSYVASRNTDQSSYDYFAQTVREKAGTKKS